MQVLQFTLPVPGDQNVILKRERGSFFYPHLHRHHELQVTLIERGTGTLVVNNNMEPFGEGDIVCIGANQPHLFKSDPSYFDLESERSISARTVFFNPDGKLKAVLELSELRTIAHFLEKHAGGFRISAETASTFAPKIVDLFRVGRTRQLTGLLDLLNQLSNCKQLSSFPVPENNAPVNESEGLRISSIYHHVMTNYSKQITLEEIAEIANMSPQAFCRYFKKRTQKTFVEFLNEVRIREACNLLSKNREENISSVAYECGFNSVTHFNRVFRRLMEKSPSAWIQLYASNTASPLLR